MLSAYFDESGTHSTSPAVTIAACLTPDIQWRKFEKEWKACLVQEGLSFFHMTDYENRQGPYKGWTEEKRVPFVRSLHKVIRKRVQVLVSASLSVADYEPLMPFYSPNSPYIFCTQQCLLQIRRWADEEKVQAKINYVFERGAGYGNDLSELTRQILAEDSRRSRLRFGSVTFADKRTCSPLQAADILAYEGYKEMVNYKIPGKGLKPIRRSALNLITGRDKYCVYLAKENIEKELARVSSALQQGPT